MKHKAIGMMLSFLSTLISLPLEAAQKQESAGTFDVSLENVRSIFFSTLSSVSSKLSNSFSTFTASSEQATPNSSPMASSKVSPVDFAIPSEMIAWYQGKFKMFDPLLFGGRHDKLFEQIILQAMPKEGYYEELFPKKLCALYNRWENVQDWRLPDNSQMWWDYAYERFRDILVTEEVSSIQQREIFQEIQEEFSNLPDHKDITKRAYDALLAAHKDKKPIEALNAFYKDKPLIPDLAFQTLLNMTLPTKTNPFTPRSPLESAENLKAVYLILKALKADANPAKEELKYFYKSFLYSSYSNK